MLNQNKRPWIVVTGAAGFIGSAIVRCLNQRGLDHLLLVDDLEKGEKWKNLLGKSFEEIISKHTLFDWLKDHGDEVSAILHLGACSDTMERDGDFLLQNNTHYTRKLAEYALKHDIRFIYASSAATYGDGKCGFSDNLDQLEELRPLNLYGWSKHLFDLWAKRHQVFDKIVGLKYFNVFGPNEAHKGPMASLIYKIYPKVRDEGLIRLFKSNDQRFGDGEQLRDFIYVKDVAEMTCQFLDNDIGGLFNIGTGQPTSWNQLSHALFHALSKPTRIEYIDMPLELAGQYQNYTCADMDKYRQTLGFSTGQNVTEYSIEDAVTDYMQNYLLKDRRW